MINIILYHLRLLFVQQAYRKVSFSEFANFHWMISNVVFYLKDDIKAISFLSTAKKILLFISKSMCTQHVKRVS